VLHTQLPTSRKVFFQNVQSTNFSVHIISHYSVLTRHFYEARINKPKALCYTYAIKSFHSFGYCTYKAFIKRKTHSTDSNWLLGYQLYVVFYSLLSAK